MRTFAQMGAAALYRRLCGFNPCGVCAVLVHPCFVGASLLCWCTWDKCTPYKYTLTYNLKEK